MPVFDGTEVVVRDAQGIQLANVKEVNTDTKTVFVTNASEPLPGAPSHAPTTLPRTAAPLPYSVHLRASGKKVYEGPLRITII